jgi:hypothetical protein
MEFIKKRTPYQDHRIITTELNLVRPYEGEYPTIEEFEREQKEIFEVEYIFLPRDLKEIPDRRFIYFKGEDTSGKGKRGFFIRYTGFVWRIYEKPLSLESIQSIPSIAFLIHHPDDARKLVRICRIQFFHRDCQGYAEAFFDSRPPSIHLKNLNPNNADKETEILLGARALIFRLRQALDKGRKKRIPPNLFSDLALKVYTSFLEDNKNNDQKELSDWEIIEKMQELSGLNIPERTFYRYLALTFGSMGQLRAEAIQSTLAKDSKTTN